MARDLGGKHVCFKCATKFYDLKKPAPICPKCGADQREAPVVKPPTAAQRRAAAAAAATTKDEEDAEVPALDTDDDVEAKEADETEEPAAEDDA